MGKKLLERIKYDKFSKVTNKIIEEMCKKEYPFPAGYEYNLERNKIWSRLGNQVIGVEIDKVY